jgi:hypothetical protein
MLMQLLLTLTLLLLGQLVLLFASHQSHLAQTNRQEAETVRQCSVGIDTTQTHRHTQTHTDIYNSHIPVLLCEPLSRLRQAFLDLDMPTCSSFAAAKRWSLRRGWNVRSASFRFRLYSDRVTGSSHQNVRRTRDTEPTTSDGRSEPGTQARGVSMTRDHMHR